MISRLVVQGYKALKDFEQPLTPLTVLIGKNDSGKSSLLEAIMALARSAQGHLADVFAGRDLGEIAWRGAPTKTVRWVIDLADQSAPLRYALTVADAGGIALADEQLRCGSQLFFRVPGDSTSIVGRGRFARPPDLCGAAAIRVTSLFQSDADQVRRARTLVAATRYYQLSLRATQRPSVIEPGLGVPTLDARGHGLPSVIAALKHADSARFQRVQDALQAAIPAIREIVVRPTTVEVPTMNGHPIWAAANVPMPGVGEMVAVPGHRLAFVLDNRWEIPAEHASAGALLFLAYLAIIFSENPPQRILIEEPENGIHPRRLQLVVELLRKLTQGVEGAAPTQVILTTHSPYLLDHVKPEEVLIFRRGADGAAEAKRLADAPFLHERLDEQLPGELWYNLGEDRLYGDKSEP